MFTRILRRIRESIRTRQYVLTLHAEEEKEADGLSILDVENCILVGTIIERQRDKQFSEPKYRISGRTIAGHEMEVIVKLGPTGKLVIITVYLV